MAYNPSFTDLANFGSQGLDMGNPTQTTPSRSEAKREQLQLTSLMKKAMYGTPEEQRVLATALAQGNEIAQDPGLQDIVTLDPLEFAARYGSQAALDRAEFARSQQALTDLKNRERSTEQTVADSAISAGLAAGNIAGGLASLGAVALDEATGSNLSPTVARGMEWVNEQGRGLQSDLLNERREQHVLEGELDRQDREAQYQRDLQEGDDDTMDWLRKQGRAFTDTIKNYADDPMVLGDKVPEAVGSIAGMAGVIRSVGRKALTRQLMKNGMNKTEVNAFLKTARGKELLNQASVRVAPVMIGGIEGGSSAQQTQQAILGLSEEDLMESTDYQALRAEGLSHEEAREQLSTDAASYAAAAAVPGAIVAGTIAAPFAANPLRTGAKGTGIGSSVVGAGRNITREGVEETLQGVNSQLASNVGQRNVGMDVALDEGVAEAGAEGLVGGIAGAGALQAPGAVVGTATEGARAAVAGVNAAVNARDEQIARQQDETSVVGSRAQNEAQTNLLQTGTQVLETLSSPTAPAAEEGQTTPNQSTPDPVTEELRTTVNDALFLDPEESKQMLDQMPELQDMTDDEGRVPRKAAIDQAAKMVRSDNGLEQILGSLALIEDYEKIQKLESTKIRETVEGLEETNDLRAQYAAMQNDLRTIEADPTYKQARELIQKITPAMLENENPELVEAIRGSLTTIASYNPTAVNQEFYQTALDQIDSSDTETRKQLEAAKKVAKTIEETDQAKAELETDMDNLLNQVAPGQAEEIRSKRRPTYDQVRNDIEVDGNRENNLPSLMAHFTKVTEAIRTGKTDVAGETLQELRNFAQSQINKMKAYNQSAKAGDGRQIGFEAYGPFGFFMQNKRPVYANTRSPNSMALVREAYIDTQAAIGLYNTLLEAYGDEIFPDGGSLKIPNLDPKITKAFKRFKELGQKGSLKEQPSRVSEETRRKSKPERRISKKAVVKASESLLDDSDNRSAVGERIVESTKPKRQPYVRTEPLKQPFLAQLKELGITLDPEGEAAKELKARGIRKSDVPGLIKEGGLRDIDNIETGVPYLDEVIAMDDTGNYYDRNALLDAILEEANGTPVRDANEEALAQAQQERASEARQNEEPDTTPNQPIPTPEVANVETQTEQEREADPGEQVEESGDTSRDEQDVEAGSESTDEGREGDVAVVTNPVKDWLDRLQTTIIKNLEGVNYFLKTFRARTNDSTLVSHDDPAQWLGRNAGQLMTETNGMQREFVSTEVQAIKHMMTNKDAYPDFHQQFEQKIIEVGSKPRKKTEKNPDGLSWFQQIEAGKDVLGNYSDARPLNFLVKKEDGTYELDRKVSAALFMASMEYVLQNTTRSTRHLDNERMAEMFGLPRGSQITGEMRNLALAGNHSQAVLDSISSKTMALLGVTSDDAASVWHTQGIPKALAANAMELLTEKKIFQVTKGRVNNQDHNMVRVNPAVNEIPAFKNLQAIRDPFTRIFTPGFEKERYIGEAPSQVEQTQLGNKLARLSPMEKQVVQRMQNTPSFINEPMHALVQTLGMENMKSILGYVDLSEASETLMNKVHRKSVEGKNLSIERGLTESLKYADEVQNIADSTGEEFGQVPIYFRWRVSSVGRLQQEGPITPQGDKIARELISATNATIDMSNETHVKTFWLAVAQSLDMKIEKQSTDTSVNAIQTKLREDENLAEAVTLLGGWLLSGELDAEAFGQALTASGIETTPKALHALLSVARFRDAEAFGSSEFTTALALEADGKTDGPINAMIHMGTGPFTAKEIERYAKGGLFFTNQPMSLSDFIDFEAKNDPSKTRGEDLYHMAAKVFHANLRQDLTEEASEEKINTLSMLDAFLPDFSLGQPNSDNEYDPEIGRNVTKNPLTVFLYGSGEDGVAQKIANEVLTNFYEVLSEIAQGREDGTLANPTDHKLFKEHPELLNQMMEVIGRDEVIKMLSEPHKAELSPAGFKTLTQNVRKHFGTPLLSAVDQATGGLWTNMNMTQKASQAQTLIFQDRFKKALAKKKADLVADGTLEEREYLSEAQMREVFADVMSIAPIYGTDAQTFHISAPQWETYEVEVSKSLGGAFSAKASMIAPADASVKVSPYLTIGTGDGRMMLNIYANGDGSLDPTLAVFDGVEQSVDKAMEASRQINEQTYKGWMEGNTYDAIYRGYEQMMDSLSEADIASLDPETKAELSRVFGLQQGERVTKRLFDIKKRELLVASKQSEARKYGIQQLATSSDHMAGIEAPHVVEGTVVGNGDPTAYEAIAAELNRLYREKIEELEAEYIEAQQTKANRPAVQPASAEMKRLVETVGEPVEGSDGVYRLRGEQLLGVITRNTSASRAQERIFKDILMKDPKFMQGTYYFGEPKALEAVRDAEFEQFRGRPIQLGQTLPGAGVAYVANLAPETVLHEMLHFHTARVLHDHYKDRSTSPDYVRDAVRRLEKLMAETRTMVAEKPDTALQTLQDELTKYEGKPATQMTEFISWMLSNQELIERGQKRKVYGPLIDVLKAGLKALKQLLGIKSNPGETLFSNVRFNTEVLLSTPDQTEASRQDTETDIILEQIYPSNERLTQIERKFLDRLNGFLSQTAPQRTGDLVMDELKQKQHDKAVAEMRVQARNASENAIYHGYRLTPRQALAFEAVYSTMMSGMKMDASVLRQVNRMYGQVVDEITPEKFLELEGKLEGYDDADYQDAARRAEFLTNYSGNRNELLANFIALSMVDDSLRGVMETMTPPKILDVKWDSIDSFVRSIGNTVVALLTRLSFERPRSTGNVRQELDRLSHSLSEIQGERRFLATMHKLSEPVDKANEFLAQGLAKGSDKLTAEVRKVLDRTTQPKLRGALSVTALITSLGSKEGSANTGDAVTKMLNHSPGYHALRELFSDLRGANKYNDALLRLINPVKAQIDALRQDYREGIPEDLAKRFNRKITREEWSRMFRALGQADMLAMGREEALALIADPSKISTKIQELEETVKNLGGKFANRYMVKSEALAEYMVNRKVTSTNLLPNAHAIANLFGEQGQERARIEKQVTDDLVRVIGQLTSLYAYRKLDDTTQNTLKELMETEANGMKHVIGTLNLTRQMELQKRDRAGATNLIAQNNGWKGFIPSVTQGGSSVIVAEDSKQSELRLKGYVRIGDYTGDGRETGKAKRGYYQSTVSGRNAFRQGVAQTVHETWQGVDSRYGYTKEGEMAGLIKGQKAAQIAKSVAAGKNDGKRAGEYLLPVFDSLGNIVAYERSMDPEKLTGLQKDTHLGRMLGVWAGRILEEKAAEEFNTKLVDVLKSIYDKAVENNETDQFVNVADPKQKDPVIRDAWDTLGWRIKQDAEQIFGKENFLPVRRDMVNDAIGYRAATVTDPWSGISRWSPETQKNIQKTMIRIMGVDAYRYLTKGQEVVHDAVSYAKTNIIVRSLVVAYDNMISNVLHLGLRGINPIDTLKGLREKFVEITQYVKNKERIDSLNLELAANFDNPSEAKKTKAKIRALEAANAKLSIKPLIDAGEFSTISENLTEADVSIREGRWADWLEKVTDKLPNGFQGVAKNFLITKDTALFQGLNRMVQYGDFISKAVLYDHLTQKEKMSHDDAIGEIMEEFVQYNRLPGRSRDFLESNGLLWFWNYKLRIQKIAVKMMRERPLHSLFLMGGIGPSTGADTVWSGSLAGAILDDRIGYSIGTEMGFNSIGMNPWINLTN